MGMQRPAGAGQFDAVVSLMDRLHTKEVLYCDKYTTFLYLGYRGLTELPDLSKCTSLQYLYLSGNQLTELPDLSALTSLQQLDLSNNKLTVLPDLSALTSLQYLYLSNNKLTEFPDLSALTSLQQLDLSNNQLSELPVFVIGNISALYYINVQFNRITDIPQELISRFGDNIRYECNPGHMDYYWCDITYNNNKGEVLSMLYGMMSAGWNMSVSMQYDQEEFRAQLSEHAVQEDRERISVAAAGKYSLASHNYW